MTGCGSPDTDDQAGTNVNDGSPVRVTVTDPALLCNRVTPSRQFDTRDGTAGIPVGDVPGGTAVELTGRVRRQHLSSAAMRIDDTDLLTLVRERCRTVAERSASVRIDPARIDAYAAGLVRGAAAADLTAADDPWRTSGVADVEDRVALVVALDAINFGSGYHDHVRKLPGRSGATTMATLLRTWAGADRAIRADRLAALGPDDAHRIFDQPRTEPMIELMAAFTASLNELGRFVADEHDGSFLDLVSSAHGSAPALVATFASLPTYADVSPYDDLEVPFLKRAQITVADLHRAFDGRGPGAFAGIDDLTAFADNLVPHVLRVDGVIQLDPALAQAIDRGDLLRHDSPEEVELRACGVHAVELLRAALAVTGVELTSASIDQILWRRGGGARYKAVRRPRARTTAY